MNKNWPFLDPPNVAAFTTKSVAEGTTAILHVSHDADDGAWQFHDGEEPREENAAVLALREIVQIDPTVVDLHDLPLGWVAHRETPSSPWIRSQAPT